LGGDLPPLLADAASARGPVGAIADLGCGDGAVIWALTQAGVVDEVYAVDLSPERVAAAERAAPRVRGIVASATRVSALPDASVDAVVASQLIEHLPNDRELAPEIARLLRPGGWFYVGSVLRRRRAWWIYRVGKTWRLDPTHVREYRSRQEFEAALEHPQLQVEEVRVTPFKFPVLDLVLRAAAAAGAVAHERLPKLYLRVPTLFSAARRVQIRPPGYSRIEAVGVRR
jgi:SAM-dependent methyltransferase